MYIIFKINDHSQRAVEWIAKTGETIHTDRTTFSVNVKTTSKLIGSIQFIDRRLKVWVAGEPSNHIFIDFRDLVSVSEL